MKIVVACRNPLFWIDLWIQSNPNVSIQKDLTEQYDVLVAISDDTYINVDNFNLFLDQKTNFSSDYITIVHRNSVIEITSHPDFHRCNYLGYIGKSKIKDVNLETLICCSNMTEKMMLVYYNWKGIHPFRKEF